MFLLQRSFIDCLTCQAAEGKWSLQTSQLVFQLNTTNTHAAKICTQIQNTEHFCHVLMIGALREVLKTHVNNAVLKSSALLIPKQTKVRLDDNSYCVRTSTFYTTALNFEGPY